MYDAWHIQAKGQYFDEVTEAFCKKRLPKAECITIIISSVTMVIFTDDNASIFFAGGR